MISNSLVYRVCVELIEVINAVLQLAALGAAVNGVVEQIDVRVQRELVHGVDAGQVVQSEE